MGQFLVHHSPSSYGLPSKDDTWCIKGSITGTIRVYAFRNVIAKVGEVVDGDALIWTQIMLLWLTGHSSSLNKNACAITSLVSDWTMVGSSWVSKSIGFQYLLNKKSSLKSEIVAILEVLETKEGINTKNICFNNSGLIKRWEYSGRVKWWV